MIKLYKQQNLIYRLITLAVLGAALYFVCRIAYGGIRSFPYSREFLEPSNVALTYLFLDGKSPYTLSSLSWDVPGVNYDYPFVGSLLAALIAKITQCLPVIAHLIISFISIIASGVIGVLMVKDRAKTSVAPALTLILFMFCHWRFGYISAAPDDLGLFLFLLTLYLAVNEKISHKPIWCAVGITLCFYTKQYFVLVAVPIFVYFLLYSWREAFKLVFWAVLINLFIATVITINWPLYWMKTIALTYLGTVPGGGGEIETLLDQMGYLSVPFAALFLLIGVALFMSLRKMKKNGARLKRFNIPENDAFVLSVVNSVVMILPLSYLGRNDGAFISYFLQLWIHSIAVVAVICFERMMNDEHRYIYAGIYVAIALFTIYFGFGKLPSHILTNDEISDWEKAYDYTGNYSEEGDVFYARSLAYAYFLRNTGDCLCGHDAEISDYTVSNIYESGLSTVYFPYMSDLVAQNIEYREQILYKVKNHKYSMISIETDGDYHLIDEEICDRYGYRCIDIINLRLGNWPYEVKFYALQ